MPIYIRENTKTGGLGCVYLLFVLSVIVTIVVIVMRYYCSDYVLYLDTYQDRKRGWG